jgi:hypothetical protein
VAAGDDMEQAQLVSPSIRRWLLQSRSKREQGAATSRIGCRAVPHVGVAQYVSTNDVSTPFRPDINGSVSLV